MDPEAWLLIAFVVGGLILDRRRHHIPYRWDEDAPPLALPPAKPLSDGEADHLTGETILPSLPEKVFPQYEPLLSQYVKPYASPPQGSWKARQSQLEARLKADDCLDLLDLVYATPIRLMGKQRSGKSTLAKVLALLRCIYIKGHTVEAWSPNDENKEKMPWPSNFRTYGLSQGRANFLEISSRMTAFIEALESGDRTHPQTLIWDEFGAYGGTKQEVEEGERISPEILLKGLRMALQMSDKHQKFVIIILHGQTNAFLSNTKGLQAALNEFPTIRRTTIKQKLGKRVPSPEFQIVDPDENEGEPMYMEMPDWLTPDHLLGVFPELAEYTPVADVAGNEMTEPKTQSDVESMSTSSPTPPPTSSPTLPPTSSPTLPPTSSPTPPEPVLDPLSQEISEFEKGQILDAYYQGYFRLEEIVLAVWGITKHGKNGYSNCSRKVKEVLTAAGEEEERERQARRRKRDDF